MDRPRGAGAGSRGESRPRRGGPGRRDATRTLKTGDDIATSWFLAVGVFDNATFKLIRWGNGSHHPPLLFDLDADPNEDSDLSSSRPDVVAAMDAMLLGVVDYPAVANDVAAYGGRRRNLPSLGRTKPASAHFCGVGRRASDPLGETKSVSAQFSRRRRTARLFTDARDAELGETESASD